jgi:ATP-binding protein involved in chromosome partitioning
MTAERPSDATTPTAITQAGPRALAITWADGVRHVYPVRDLRLACGCARCVDEWTGEERLEPGSVPEDVHPRRVEGVGRYALQIAWSDGHETGIYPFRRLRALGEAWGLEETPGAGSSGGAG